MSLLAALLARLLTVAPYLLVGWLLEVLIATAQPRESRRGLNLSLMVLYWLSDVLTVSTLGIALTALALRLPGHGLLASILPDVQRMPATFAVACIWIVIGDGFYYWMHRAQHQWAWLWAEHAVHHSDPAMNVTTTFRHHWLEKPIEAVLVVAPLSYLFTPPMAVAVAAGILRNAIGHFIHTDVRIGFGRVGWLMAHPQQHRIHHSRERRHFDVNFAAVCPLWDVLFGTYYQAAPDEYPDTGVDDLIEPRTVREASALPFRVWLRHRATSLSTTAE